MAAVIVLLFGLAPTAAVAQSVGMHHLVLALRYDPQGKFPLTRIAGLALGPDERLFVGDALGSTIFVFDENGQPYAEIGGRGRGPGQFDQIATVGVWGDTLWATDPSLHRIVFFTREGQHLATFAAGLAAGPNRGWRFPVGFSPYAVLRGGLVAQRRLSLASRAQAMDRRMGITLLDWQGAIVRTLAELDPGRSRLIVRGPGGMTVSTYQPFDDSPLWAVSPDGASAVVVQRESATDAEGASFTVIRYGADGLVELQSSCRYRPMPISEQGRDSVVNRAARSNLELFGESFRAAVDGVEGALYLPDFHTPVAGVFVGSDGRIWLREAPTTSGLSYVLGPSGAVVARVAGPNDLTLLAADDRYAWGFRYDEYDVPRIVKFEIQAGAGAWPATGNDRAWQCEPIH